MQSELVERHACYGQVGCIYSEQMIIYVFLFKSSQKRLVFTFNCSFSFCYGVGLLLPDSFLLLYVAMFLKEKFFNIGEFVEAHVRVPQ
jgi:hypothetical protein